MNRKFAFLLGLTLAVGLIFTNKTTGQTKVSDFVGQWALYLPGGAGWLEVSDNGDYLDAKILWYGGSVVPVSSVYVHDGKLIVNRVFEVDHGDRKMQQATSIEFEVNGNQLIGKQISPNKNGKEARVTLFYGKKTPEPGQAPNLTTINYGKAIKVFNGKNLDGWELINPNHKNGWSVEKGVLTNNPGDHNDHSVHYGNLKTKEAFEDFKLTYEVNVPEGSNSGVYLRGIYEVQVVDSYGADLDPHNMGALYSRITPSVAAEKKAGEWQEFEVILYQRHLTVKLNGKTIINNQPVLGVTGGAMTADVFSAGPIYLQGDHGQVSYRNMVLTPIVK